MNILYVGPKNGTCLHRAEAFRALGHDVAHIPSAEPQAYWALQLYRVANRLKLPADLVGTNRTILRCTRADRYDLLWIDKGLTVRPQTLARVREHSAQTRLVSYSPDDIMNPGNQSERYLRGLSLYDLHVTTKSYNVAELKQLGARDALFVDNAFDPASHRPLELTPAERSKYGADVGFAGHFGQNRAAQMLRLARNGVEVSVWGGGWAGFGESHPGLKLNDEEVWGLEYAKVINATKINLGFLRKINRDLQTTRSIEIPACGGFMLAERTDEHLRLFEEGKEAEFFESFDELLQKCRYYREHDEERRRIAAAGLARCKEGGYSNADRLRRVLDYLRGRPRQA